MSDNSRTITIPEWNPTFKFKNRDPFSMLITGARRSGKSFFVRWLLTAKLIKNTDRFYIFCNNRQELAKYLDTFGIKYDFRDFKESGGVKTFKFGPGNKKSVRIAEEFDEGVIKSVMDFNNQLISQGKKACRVLLLFDDSFGREQKNSDSLNQVYCTGRHFEISCIFLMQYFKQSGTMFRGNSDYIVISKQKISGDYIFLAKEIVGGTLRLPMDTKNQTRIYAETLQHYTNKQGDIVILDTSGSPENNDDELFRFRAP